MLFFKKLNFNDIESQSDFSLFLCKKFIFGFNKHLLVFFKKRLEIKQNLNVKKTSPIKFYILYKTIFNIYPSKISLIKKQLTNIILLDSIQTYKGWRHSRGLPCNGQRTWTNGWSSYKSNLFLRQFKLKIAHKIYGQLNSSEVNTAYLAEQINLLWRVQWESEWASAKKNRLKSYTKRTSN